jgi:predicted Zn-dependent protease
MPYSADYKSRFESANRLRKTGDAEGAIRVLRALVADFPKQAAAYLIIGDILWDEGRLPAAAAAFRVATTRFPKLEIASLGLFHTLWRQSKTDAAFAEMKRFQNISHSQDYKEIVDEILQEA